MVIELRALVKRFPFVRMMVLLLHVFHEYVSSSSAISFALLSQLLGDINTLTHNNKYWKTQVFYLSFYWNESANKLSPFYTEKSKLVHRKSSWGSVILSNIFLVTLALIHCFIQELIVHAVMLLPIATRACGSLNMIDDCHDPTDVAPPQKHNFENVLETINICYYIHKWSGATNRNLGVRPDQTDFHIASPKRIPFIKIKVTITKCMRFNLICTMNWHVLRNPLLVFMCACLVAQGTHNAWYVCSFTYQKPSTLLLSALLLSLKCQLNNLNGEHL